MSDKGQEQKAGPHSRQYQIGGDLVIVEGVTEERAHEISRQNFREMFAQYSQESFEVAAPRVEKLDLKFIQQLAEADLLGVLGDPAFQVTLRKAQLGAASTEREADYDILASLLSDRATRSDSRPIRAGINRAVEVVDQIDDTALAGLTLMSAATQFRPMAGGIDAGLGTMEKLYAQLMEDHPLPTGIEWLEHLEILDVVRIDMVQSFKKFDQLWPERTPGYVATGAQADSEAESAARQELVVHGVPNIVADHELKPGFRRIYAPSVDILKTHLRNSGCSDEQVEHATRISCDVFGLDKPDPELTPAFMERVKSHPLHQRLGEWWDGLPYHFTITSVGKVLAKANAHRLDELGMLPPLD